MSSPCWYAPERNNEWKTGLTLSALESVSWEKPAAVRMCNDIRGIAGLCDLRKEDDMPDDAKPDWFQETDSRLEQLKELARELREGSDVPMSEQAERLKAITSEINQEQPKPTAANKERMLEALRKKHGNLPKKLLLMKEVGDRLKALSSFSQEMRRPSKQDLDNAIMLGDIAEVRRLIASGVGVNGTSAAGYSLLLSAGVHEHWEIAELLRQAGAEVGLAEAALFGDIETLRTLLDHGADIHAANRKGLTALSWAAGKGKEDAVRLLLERNAEVDHLTQNGFTALLSSALNKHSGVVKLLVAAGAKVGVVEAALLGDQNLLTRFLGEGADIETENTVNMTPLMAASACGHIKCMDTLLERGADLHKVNASQDSALTWSIRYNQREAVRLLLDHGMDVNRPDQQGSEHFRGSTLIRRAIQRQLPEMTYLLTERGASLRVRDGSGETPLHWAATACHPEVLRVLLDAGAEVDTVGIRQNTPLMNIVNQVLIKKARHLACVQLMLDRGANVNARSKHGKTPLMMAADHGHTEIVSLLLNAGADMEARDEYGFTALASAGQGGHAEVVSLLRKRGAKVSLTNFLGAALFGHKDVLKTLLFPRLWRQKRSEP